MPIRTGRRGAGGGVRPSTSATTPAMLVTLAACASSASRYFTGPSGTVPHLRVVGSGSRRSGPGQGAGGTGGHGDTPRPGQRGVVTQGGPADLDHQAASAGQLGLGGLGQRL